MKTTYKGIDYSSPGATCNRDAENGIRYGVIPQNEVLQAWTDSSEPDYGSPTCPKCGRQADKPEEFGETFASGIPDDYTESRYEESEFVCVECKYLFGSESAFGDEPLVYFYDSDGYKAECGQDGDIFVIESPYFTRAQFCSPCASGACYLLNECETGEKAYCFGHDWFEGGKAPYPVYSVETGALVNP